MEHVHWKWSFKFWTLTFQMTLSKLVFILLFTATEKTH